MTNGRHLLGMKDLSASEIMVYLKSARSFKGILRRDIKKVPTLRGRTVVNLFFEPSTRTRTSFELAAKRLSTDVINFQAPTSSILKGESLLDTVLTVEALGADIIIIRHSSSGVPHMLSRHVRASVINAGDGTNEHPTQALLDAFTIQEKKGGFKGLRVAIIGDIIHSRVAKSNIYCLKKLGSEVRLIGPATLLPDCIGQLGVRTFSRMDEGLEGADVIMMLRLQHERQGKGFFPTTEEYFRQWGLSGRRLRAAKPDAIIMHPGPMNRGTEISSEVADGGNSVILEQVTNGLAVRMAVMFHLDERKEKEQ